jgi:hypothetical protein
MSFVAQVLLFVTDVLLSVLGLGSNDRVVEVEGSSSSSMADVYKGELTPLQRHVAFFDHNKDDVIYPSETTIRTVSFKVC